MSEAQPLIREFERCGHFGHLHRYDLFRQWLELTWAFCEGWRDAEAFRKAEARYTPEQQKAMGGLFTLYVELVEKHPFRDLLGETFMALDINSARAGQFFTPWLLARAMAEMCFDKETQMSQEDFEGLKMMRRERSAQAERNRVQAGDDYHAAVRMAHEAGLVLARRSESHYQLYRSREGWLLNVDPGNQRLYSDPNHPRPPYLGLPRPWTLPDVVRAMTRKEAGRAPTS